MTEHVKTYDELEKMYMYSVEDLKAEDYGLPFFAANDDLAKRQLLYGMRNEQTPLNDFPDDFVLWQIGTWTSEDGGVWKGGPDGIKRVVCTISTLVNQAAESKVSQMVVGGMK
ncbi:nonstructural protein [Microviridae sp.]|nr:nonstructural protein [Microviridae sp.]